MLGKTLGIVAASVVFSAYGATAGINPANPGLPNVTDPYAVGASAGNPIIGNLLSAMCIDCHTNNPKPNSGTHFVVHSDGTDSRNTNNIAIERLGNWPTTLAPSKYGVVIAGALPTSDTTSARGELICESCHNLKKNVAGGNNLLGFFAENDVDELCVTCHATQAGGPPNHHPMTGNTVGVDVESAVPHVLNTTHSSHVKASPVPGGDVYYPDVNKMSCASCHTPHGAAEGGGARVLRRGYSASTLYGGTQLNLIYADNIPQPGDVKGDVKIWDTTDIVYGIDRQSDITLIFGAQFRLVTNVDPLCDACHAK